MARKHSSLDYLMSECGQVADTQRIEEEERARVRADQERAEESVDPAVALYELFTAAHKILDEIDDNDYSWGFSGDVATRTAEVSSAGLYLTKTYERRLEDLSGEVIKRKRTVISEVNIGMAAIEPTLGKNEIGSITKRGKKVAERALEKAERPTTQDEWMGY